MISKLIHIANAVARLERLSASYKEYVQKKKKKGEKPLSKEDWEARVEGKGKKEKGKGNKLDAPPEKLKELLAGDPHDSDSVGGEPDDYRDTLKDLAKILQGGDDKKSQFLFELMVESEAMLDESDADDLEDLQSHLKGVQSFLSARSKGKDWDFEGGLKERYEDYLDDPFA